MRSPIPPCCMAHTTWHTSHGRMRDMLAGSAMGTGPGTRGVVFGVVAAGIVVGVDVIVTANASKWRGLVCFNPTLPSIPHVRCISHALLLSPPQLYPFNQPHHIPSPPPFPPLTHTLAFGDDQLDPY